MKHLKSILFFLLVAFTTKAQVTVQHLICNNATNPLAIDKTANFSWQLSSKTYNVSQQAYQILVASSEEKLKKNIGDVWDSGKINSDASQNVVYQGKALKIETKYFWKVRVWLNENKASKWSATAYFRTQPSDLNPTWIGAITKADSHLPEGRNYHTATFKKEKRQAIVDATDSLARRSIQLRKAFIISKKIKEAVVYVSGLGHYELTLNGKKVGNSVFAPLWTDYDKTVYYNAYEISANDLAKGENVIGVLLGNGMYNMIAERYAKFFVSFGPPTLFLKMKVVYEDGSEQIIKTDKSWKYSKSPITFNSIFGGEDYNANLEQKGWDSKGFNDANWNPVVIQEAPKGVLRAQQTTPVQVEEQFGVKAVTEPQSGVRVFNMGQNLSGFPTIKVQGKKGQKVRLWVGEGLNDDGTVGQGRSGKPYYFEYTLKGEGVEEWHPRFSYYGYQYIQVEGANYKEMKDASLPTILDLKSNFIYNSAGKTGSFTSSNEIFNRTHELINNAIKSNFQSVLTDCPHREKLGWLEEAHLNGPGLIFNYNLRNYIPAIMQNIADAQRENGMIPTIAPEYVVFGGDFTDSPEWGVTGVILPWMYYEYYGDDSLLRTFYPVMKKYVDYLTSKAESGIVSYGLGDWYDYGEHAAGYSKNSPIALSATSHYYFGIDLVAKAAKHLNKTEDIVFYENLAKSVKDTFNGKFFDEKTKQYGTASQFSNAVPLFLDMVATENKQAVLDNLVKDIKVRNYRLTTGDVGNRYLFQVLADNGLNEVMYKMHNHYDAPGYGFQIKFGLTTLTEQWDPRKGNSWNHFMMGQIEEWFYKSLVGIVPDEANPGFKHFFLEPEIVGGMTFVKGSYASVFGEIKSEWEKKDGKLYFKCTIPANTTATVKLPVAKQSAIKINGKILGEAKQVLKVIENEIKPSFVLGSGIYVIECAL
ncbi:glycoside hydrolase family 78 protein [Flavobacterium sp. GCM10022190]|uniref:glycoside hydrolase family 78 protein n=1 Tax=Flavobacterium sp. GCM10022190 TaxID=3252639 RepID=UPI0036D24AF1